MNSTRNGDVSISNFLARRSLVWS